MWLQENLFTFSRHIGDFIIARLVWQIFKRVRGLPFSNNLWYVPVNISVTLPSNVLRDGSEGMIFFLC